MKTNKAVPTILVSKREAARLLGLSIRTLENLIAQRELVPCRIGRRVLLSRHGIEQFTRRDHRTQSVGPKP